MTTTTKNLQDQIQDCERRILEEREHLADLKQAAELEKLQLKANALPEGSLAWVKAKRDVIDATPGCCICMNQILAFDHENGWDAPPTSDLEDMSPEELADELPSLVERIHEMESLIDESSLCSYCQHMADKDD